MNPVDEVASKLELYGWTQGSFQNLKGEYCLVGAVRNVSSTPSWELNCIILQSIKETYPNRIPKYSLGIEGNIFGFNDNKKTKYRHVRKVLKKASKSWDAQHGVSENGI